MLSLTRLAWFVAVLAAVAYTMPILPHSAMKIGFAGAAIVDGMIGVS